MVFICLDYTQQYKSGDPSDKLQDDSLLLILQNYVRVSSNVHTHMPLHKSPQSHAAWGHLFEPVTFWALLHACNTTKQTSRAILVFFSLSLPLVCPLTVIFLPLSFCLGLRMRAGEEGCSKQGRREKERLAPANNPLFQHVQPYISKLKWSARKGAYKTLNVLWLNRCVHITPLPALPWGPAEYCGICSAGVN